MKELNQYYCFRSVKKRDCPQAQIKYIRERIGILFINWRDIVCKENLSEEFIREFINSSSYFYNPNIDLFFVYHNNTYKIINEDEIEHEIRTTITDQQNVELSTWKYKIKNQIQAKNRILSINIYVGRFNLHAQIITDIEVGKICIYACIDDT